MRDPDRGPHLGLRGDSMSGSEGSQSTRVVLVRGDITRQHVDAIVNAANETLLGGGGVDGAIHAAAGSGLLAECRRLGGCNTGDAKITRGYNLPAHHVIHTVGPVYNEYTPQEAARLLASCYRRSLEVAEDHGIKTIAFPGISTGIFGYPIEEAATVVRDTIDQFIRRGSSLSEIRLIQFSNRDMAVYQKVFPNAAVVL
jgi:O-acetyl-ADP-ribose deacetylase (regulator of RNase III)